MDKQTVIVNGVKCTRILGGNPDELELYGPGYQIGVTKPGDCGHNRKIGECPYCWPVAVKVTQGDGVHTDEIRTHPAFAQISVSRVSGDSNLYGSEFRHQHFMMIRIHESEEHRGLSYTRYHERKLVAEVALSESQYATMISSPNQGSGVPCTLYSVGGKTVSRLPDPETTKTETFAKEMKDRLAESLGAMAELKALMAQGKGGTKAAEKLLERAQTMLKNNTEYVAGMFGEYMDDTKEKAKQEINAYINAEVRKAGLEALGAKKPIALQDKKPLELGE
jgi:hypothetical protein